MHQPNRKKCKAHFTKQSKLGSGPQQREFRAEIHQAKQVGVGAPTKRISSRNSPNKASWGRGPNKENFEQKFAKQSKLGLRKLSPKLASP
ncbi:hypothetical protein FO456_02580 [Staphylococcus lugdunensis]|nr:hypothetical protein FO456_02580 [Staphylococcus lugdunensis]